MKTRLERLNLDNNDKQKHPMTREEFILAGLELLRNSKSCGFILEQDVDLLLNRYDVDAKKGVAGINELDLFLKYGALTRDDILFLVIHNIEFIGEEKQSKFFSLVKDRCIHTLYDLLDGVIVVFALSSNNACNKVLYSLWNLGSNFIDL